MGMAGAAMNSALMFSKASDEWATPLAFYVPLDAEFDFALDAAATADNSKCSMYLGPDHAQQACRDALTCDWNRILGSSIADQSVWLNPPYSRCKEFVAKAADERRRGVRTVMLMPSRTDTRWFHEHLWDADKNTTRPGIELRFVRGRLKFGDGKNSAPFPSMVVVFRQ
jgi:phage N-6-adenine-methyltransferase